MSTPTGFEELSAEEIEDCALGAEDLEEIENEAIEEESESDDLVEDLAAELAEEEGAEAEARRKRKPPVVKMLVRRIIRAIKRIVQKLLKNPRTARKLRDAVKKGPAATCRLICPLVCRLFPPPLRFLCGRLCPIICRRLFPWIRKTVGVKAEEVAEEF